MATNFRLKTVHVVREGMQGGYMPDSLAFFATKSGARAYMVDQAKNARAEGMKVYGSAQDGYYSIQDPDASIYHTGNSIVLDSINADMYVTNIPAEVKTMDDLVQYLNDHYSS